jgi:hypothetical protein
MPDVDFGAIGAQVEANLSSGGDGTNANVASATPSAPPQTATPSTPAAPQQTANGQQPVAAPSSAEDLIEVRFPDGRTETIARKDLPNAILMQRDYTQKTQRLAEREKQFQPILTAAQQLAQEREQITQLFSNPAALAQFAQEQYGAEFARLFQPSDPNPIPGVAPDDIITAQQAAQIAEQRTQAYLSGLQQKLQQLESRFEGKTKEVVEQGIQQLKDSQEVATHQKALDAHVDSLFEAHPLLKAVPEMGDALRFRVFNRNPQTQEEAMKYLSEEAVRQEKALQREFENLNKAALAGKAKLASTGIEPPGGVGVQPEPQSFKKKDGSIDWKALSGAATDFVANSRR